MKAAIKNKSKMERQVNQENYSVKPQPSLSILGVLKEALKTTNRNGKLALSILLLVFLSLSQLDLVRNFVLASVGKDLSSQLSNHGNFQDFSSLDQTTRTSIRELLVVKLLILTFSCVVLLFFSISTISSSSEAYTAKVVSLKEMFLKIRSSWKNPVVTSFYLSLITLGIISLYVISTAIITIVAGVYSSYLLYTVTIISIPFCYIYMASLGMMSVVVSVLEADCSGLKAIDRAGELIKGKRVQAYVIMLLFSIAYGVVHLTSNALTSNLDKWGRLAITIPFTNGLICGLKLLMFVAYTVFYHERKMNHKEEGVKGRGGLYFPLAANEA